MQQSHLTEAQNEMLGVIGDAAEHVAWEFNESKYQGVSTCGFAHISGLNGNKSFVRRIKSMAGSDNINWVKEDRRGDYRIDVGGLELRLSKDEYNGGYRLSITNVQDYISGPEYQRMDVRQRLHSLLLDRLKYHGYAQEARIMVRPD